MFWIFANFRSLPHNDCLKYILSYKMWCLDFSHFFFCNSVYFKASQIHSSLLFDSHMLSRTVYPRQNVVKNYYASICHSNTWSLIYSWFPWCVAKTAVSVSNTILKLKKYRGVCILTVLRERHDYFNVQLKNLFYGTWSCFSLFIACPFELATTWYVWRLQNIITW